MEPTPPLGESRPLSFVASSDVQASGHPLADTGYRPVPRDVPAKPARGARTTPRRRFAALVAEFKAAPFEWRQAALLLAVAVVGLSALGAFYDFTGRLHWFQVSGEIRDGFFVPVLFSFGVLFGAGVVAVLRSRWAETPTEQYAWIGVGVFLAFMAFDELLMIHESVEFRTGVDWQLIYLPVVAVGGVAYLWLLGRMPRWSLEQVMWLAAGGMWAVSQVFEKIEYRAGDVPVAHFRVYDGIEKVLQFTGSTLFLLVALLALERVFSRAREDAPRISAR